MVIAERELATETFTLRLDPKLKEDFASIAAQEERSVSDVLRDLMQIYIEKRRRERFEAEARRQSALAAESPDEEEVMRWIEDVSDLEANR